MKRYSLDELTSFTTNEHAKIEPFEIQKKSSRFKPYLAILFIPFAILATAIPSVYNNRHLFLPKIDLTKEERLLLPSIRHQLQTVDYQFSTQLPDQLSRPIVLVGDELFSQVWKNFLSNYSISESCDLAFAVDCVTTEGRKIFIIDMRSRNWKQILGLLKSGHNVIAYGAGASFDSGVTTALGLRSGSSEITRSDYLSLVNDKELSLGITKANKLFVGESGANIFVASDNAQAISILPDGIPGGTLIPRLHAKSLFNSRFIWMDFLPPKLTRANQKHQKNFEALAANIFRYIDDNVYESVATWPFGKKIASYLAVDLSASSDNLEKLIRFGTNSNTPLTSFVSSNGALEKTNLVRQLSNLGEVGCKGDNLDIITRYSMFDQTIKVGRCKKTLSQLLGRDIHGFRPPEDNFNQNTLNAIINADLQYTLLGQSISSNLPLISQSHTGPKLLRIPRVNSDSYQLWTTLELNDEDSFKRLINELDWVLATGGLFGFNFRDEHITTQSRASVINALSRELNNPEVYSGTISDIAQWWLLRNSLLSQTKNLSSKQDQLIKQYQPVILSVNSSGQLNRKYYGE